VKADFTQDRNWAVSDADAYPRDKRFFKLALDRRWPQAGELFSTYKHQAALTEMPVKDSVNDFTNVLEELDSKSL
jgi:hypothetical protein